MGVGGDRYGNDGECRTALRGDAELAARGLAYAMRSLPVGTSYAVWTGIGAVGTVLVGIVAFGESADAVRLLCIGLILAGILGLKFVTP